MLSHLSDKIHPRVLGTVYRSQSQIQMLARKRLAAQITEEPKMNKIISSLGSQSGSPDYAIHRREARDKLGLKVEKPNDVLCAPAGVVPVAKVESELGLGRSGFELAGPGFGS